MHDFNCFVTLTYNDANLPQHGTLVKEDLQKFHRALRDSKHFHPIKIKYFACGEYGDQTKRPHYHTCLFGIDFPDKQLWKKNEQGNSIFTSAICDNIWKKGQCFIGALTAESASYVARYTLKKAGKTFDAGHYQKVDLQTGEIIDVLPEFQTASNRPGIGAAFFDKYAEDIYPDDFVLLKGGKHKPPRYYDKLLERHNPARLAKIKIHRQDKADKKSHDNTTARLRVREEVKQSQISTLKRSIN